MVNRRDVLIGVSAALSVAATSSSALAEFLEPLPPKNASNEAVDESLRKELARLAPRANSEEGVPMFLACINLVPDKSSPKPQLTALNKAIAAEFRQTAAAWERIKPNPPVADVAEVIVVMADRDFLSGGTEQTS